MGILIIAVLIVLVGFMAAGLKSSLDIVYPEMRTDEFFEDELNKYKAYDKLWYENLNKKEFYIKSKYGYNVYLTYVKNEIPTQHTIIICHGVTVRTEAVIKYLDMFLKNGYNALFIDHRAHGKTGGKRVSYGYYERYDLAEAIKWVRKEHAGKIGLIGESMGAGISLQTLLVEKVDFVIADCGYSSLDEEVKHQIRRNKGIPLYPVYYFSRLFVYLLGGYDIKKVSPIEAVKQSDTPVLIVHGDKDDYVPFYMASIIYDNVKSKNKMLFVTEGTKHALSYEEYPLEYQEQVHKFLQSCSMPCTKEFVA